MLNPDYVLFGVSPRWKPEMGSDDNPTADRGTHQRPPGVLYAYDRAEMNDCLGAPTRTLVDPRYTTRHQPLLADFGK